MEGSYPIPDAVLDKLAGRRIEVSIQDLHHNGNLYDDFDRFRLRARAINQYLRRYRARGFRSGRLYRNADWLSELDIAYDMSFPNVGRLDAQPGGCCSVFPYFISDILEIPLTTTQDYSLLHVIGDQIDRFVAEAEQMILAKHGLISILVHPDYSMKGEARKIYETLLGYLADLRERRNLWMALPQEIDRWWRQRARLEAGQARRRSREIQGQGREQARVAYAVMEAGRLVYKVQDGPSLMPAAPGAKRFSN